MINLKDIKKDTEKKDIKNKIYKYFPDIVNLGMESKSQIQGIIKILEEIIISKKNYKESIEKQNQNNYKKCIEIINSSSKECIDKIK